MSWQAYVDTNLVGSKQVTKAAIWGLQGGQWAASPGFTLSADEHKKIVAAFKDPSAIRASGVFVGGVKYMALKCDERSIYAKKGATGVVIVKTTKAILIGYYDENIQPGNATNVVEKLADYLIEQGY